MPRELDLYPTPDWRLTIIPLHVAYPGKSTSGSDSATLVQVVGVPAIRREWRNVRYATARTLSRLRKRVLGRLHGRQSTLVDFHRNPLLQVPEEYQKPSLSGTPLNKAFKALERA